MKQSYNERIINSLTEQLDKGIIPWTKPWVCNGSGILSATTGKPYSLRNRMLLHYAGEYATFNQIRKSGGAVNKGEHATPVYFYKHMVKTDDDGNVLEDYRYLTVYAVFRVGTQTTGIEPKYEHLWGGGGLPKDDSEVMLVLTTYAQKNGIRLITGGQSAFYNLHDDIVQVPGVDNFGNHTQFWHTIFHELIHSTGAKSRLNRNQGHDFGDKLYAREELVADIGACLCLGRLGIDTEKCITNSASYIDFWRRHLTDYESSFGAICRDAELATDLIFGGVV